MSNPWWVPVELNRVGQRFLEPPVSGETAQNPPVKGARPPSQLADWWRPPPDPPPKLRHLSPPQAGVSSQVPPLHGPNAGLTTRNRDSWWTPLELRRVRNPILVPPVSGPSVPTTAALFSLFNDIVAGHNTTWCDFDLYTISLFNGGVIRITTADFDILSGGNLYLSGGVRVDQKSSKAQAHWKVGLDVDTWTVTFMPRPTDPVTGASFPDKVGSIPWAQAAHSGYFDAADIQVDRAYFSAMPTWPIPPTGAVPLGTKTIFAGKVEAADCTDIAIVFTFTDYRDLLSVSMPRHVYQGACRHTLFDVGCNASGNMRRESFAANGTVAAGSTNSNIVVSGLAAPSGSGTYALGLLVMTSGLNNTFSRTVASWDGFNLKLVVPLPFDVSPGDTFNVSPGCDLQLSTCVLFGNSINFGGQPYIPAPETLAT